MSRSESRYDLAFANTAFERRQVPYGGNTVRSEIFARCATCDHEDSIGAVSSIPPDIVAKKFQQKGWDVERRLKWAICPKCLKTQKPKQETKPMTPQGTAKPIALIPAGAIQPRPLTLAETRTVCFALESHFDEKLGRYSGDWSDDKVAREANVPRAAVTKLRDEAFGPLKIDPAIANEMNALKTSIDGLAAELAKATDNLTGRLAALESRLATLRQKVSP